MTCAFGAQVLGRGLFPLANLIGLRSGVVNEYVTEVMKVFISWSGERSKAVAELLDEWI